MPSQEGRGFEPHCRQMIFSRKISVKVHLHDHLVVDLIHSISVSRIMYYFFRV